MERMVQTIARAAALIAATLIFAMAGFGAAVAQVRGEAPAAMVAQCDSAAAAQPAGLQILLEAPQSVLPMSPKTYDLAWGRCPGNQKECHGYCIGPYDTCCRGGGMCNAGSGGCCAGGCCQRGSYCAIVNGVEGCYRRY